MKHCCKMLSVVVLALPLPAYSQNSTVQSSQGAETLAGHRDAVQIIRASAGLMRPLDARKDQSGSAVQAKLRGKVTLSDGAELASGTILIGQVTVDDMQEQGMSRLALCFNQARLRNGTEVPIKATIVGIFGLREDTYGYPVEGGGQVSNIWTDGTLQVDQIDVAPGVDLHSRISSRNSGVFVSTKKDDVKLKEGTEIQFAIGPGKGQSNTDISNAEQNRTSASGQN